MGAALRNSTFRRPLALVLAGALLCALLPGCQPKTQTAETTIFAMDTVMVLTIYGTDQEACHGVLVQAVEQIYALEHTLSVTDENSEIYAVNRAGGTAVPLSAETAGLIQDALALCEATGGALDITAYPAVRAWGFTTGEYRVPQQPELDTLAALIDYSAVELDLEQNQISLPEGMELDLGAVVKGCTGDILAQLVEAHQSDGVTCAMLNLGQSSIQTVGAKPDGSPWRVGIQNPAGESYLGILEITGQAVGTSGGYQRYFEENGQTYWHIMDPATAAPARSGLASVTIVGASGLVCDGLSTALFVMGLEEGAAFWRAHPELEFDAIFISDDGSIAITAGLEDAFSLADGQQGREVTVLT